MAETKTHVKNIECPRCHTTARYVGYSNAGPEFVCDNMHLVGLPDGEAKTPAPKCHNFGHPDGVYCESDHGNRDRAAAGGTL